MPRDPHPERPPCPRCNEHYTKSTRTLGLNTIGGITAYRRERTCSRCGHKFTTAEIHENALQ